MKISRCSAVLILGLALGATNSVAQTDDVVNQAVEGVNRLQEAMRDPDSFALDRVTMTPPNKKGKSNVCFVYRARNGFGGMNRGEAAYGQHHDLKLAEANDALGVGWYGCYRRDVIDITNAVLKALKPPDSKAAASANADDKVKVLEKELADLKAKQAADSQQAPATAIATPAAPTPTAPKTISTEPSTPAKSSTCKSIMTDSTGRTTCMDSAQ
jgi:hypothetical protein